MSITKTLGGDRLGSGKKQKVTMHGFERSTHDLGNVFRTTMSAGTLVPFMVQVALPGDTWDINLGADVKTLPTVGPLFGSFKLQLDIFEAPIRLYHAWLHNNKLKVGLNISSVKFPQIDFTGINDLDWYNTYGYEIPMPLEFQQINQSSLFSYLGIRGIGQTNRPVDDNEPVYQTTMKNAIPYLAFWEIYKNYYSNKQEEIGMMIHRKQTQYLDGELKVGITGALATYSKSYDLPNVQLTGSQSYDFELKWYGEYTNAPAQVAINVINPNHLGTTSHLWFSPVATDMTTYTKLTWSYTPAENTQLLGVGTDVTDLQELSNEIEISKFDLSLIDDMRDKILRHATNEPFIVNKDSGSPYSLPLQPLRSLFNLGQITAMCSQEGLPLKTYQSDIFNNWLNTEWLDGAGGINEISSVEIVDGKFSIDSLNLAKKVYDWLNRIAVSGGTYNDWLETSYDHDAFRLTESPMYYGGLSKEIVFQEVINQSANNSGGEEGTEPQPLGTLAGKGIMAKKHKGGSVYIKVNEPSYIIGIVSITPRIDYSSGNSWDSMLDNMGQLHIPGFDQIGFQDLLTDQMAFWDTRYIDNEPVMKSAGKQPAWINYMTNYNQLYGNFADVNNQMYMTLARRYEPTQFGEQEEKTIRDLTTYIDPTKFNYAFAKTDLTSQNFMVQIGIDSIVRRKMSAKIMPNL